MPPHAEHNDTDIPFPLLEQLLHPRICDACGRNYMDADWKGVVHVAMLEVEHVLREAAGELRPDGEEGRGWLCGDKLINRVWELHDKVGLVVPFGKEYQQDARKLFQGAFGYYRNYTNHDIGEISQRTCIRVMILASELLDLVHASSRSFTGLGGVDGLIKAGWFRDNDEIKRLLVFLSGQSFPYNTCDGFYEDLLEKGYTEAQVEAMFEFGLVRYRSEVINHNLPNEDPDYDECGWLELTQLGRSIAGDIPEENL